MEDKPTRYYIAWSDSRKLEAVAKRKGRALEDVDPLDYWETQEASNSLVGAISKAKAVHLRTGDEILIYERLDIQEWHPHSEIPSYTEWEWDRTEEIGYVRYGNWHRN